ncbi:MAG: AraC family transcriptional regulator [Phenylobacterium sp.]
MTGPTVGAGFARGLFELAVRQGADRRALAEAAGVRPAELEDQDARIPFAKYVAIMRAGKALSGDAALGLHYGEQVDIADVSIVGLLGQASRTPMEAFQQLNRFVPLIVETDLGGADLRFGMVAERGSFWIVDNRTNPNAFPELSESAFAQLVCGRRRVDPTPLVKSVHFTHADPGYAPEYERIFQAPVVFGAQRNAFEVRRSVEPENIARLPRYVFGVLSERADALLRELQTVKSTRARVESLLMARLHTGDVSMEEVAAEMAVSRQTLFRRLKAEDVTFEKVLDELRCRMALDYLSARKVSVNETAYLVGFSDPAAFSRAFKRWTGQNPSAMRSAA